MTHQIEAQAALLIKTATDKGWRVATAESCTGGLISAALTDIAGSSAVFSYGFVTYANEAKRDLLGVPQAMLDHHGAVSSPVATAMAQGARLVANADLAVSVTGIAGPGGGSPDKPVGLVYFGCATRTKTVWQARRFPPAGRQFIRERTVLTALAMMRHALST